MPQQYKHRPSRAYNWQPTRMKILSSKPSTTLFPTYSKNASANESRCSKACTICSSQISSASSKTTPAICKSSLLKTLIALTSTRWLSPILKKLALWSTDIAISSPQLFKILEIDILKIKFVNHRIKEPISLKIKRSISASSKARWHKCKALWTIRRWS